MEVRRLDFAVLFRTVCPEAYHDAGEAPVGLAEAVREAAIAEFDGAVEVKQFGGESQMKVTTQYLVADESSEADAAAIDLN